MRIWLMAAVLLGACGCISVDYVGQSYDVDPRRPIQWFNSPLEVPENIYQVIGRASVGCSSDFDQIDVRDAIMAEAEKRGADAVQVVSSGRRVVRYTHVNDTGFNEFGSNTRESRREGAWTPYDSFGQPASRQVNARAIEEFHAKVLFMVKKERYETTMQVRRQERRRTIETTPLVADAQPAAPVAEEKPVPVEKPAAETPPVQDKTKEINEFLDAKD